MSDAFTTETNPTTGEPQTPTSTDAFSTTEDFVAKLVGEKGETWKDPQAIAKGYLHAQNRIAELEQATKEMAKQDYAKQLLEQLQAKQTPPPVVADEATIVKTGSDNEDNTSLSADDIQRLLKEELSKRETDGRVQGNLDKVNKVLSEKFGTEANATVQKKAEQLGISVSKMQELAGESPEAFLSLVGEAPVKETNATVKSTINTTNFTNANSGERNKAYYTKLRRENRKSYNSAEVQAQMLQDRMALGDKFYT